MFPNPKELKEYLEKREPDKIFTKRFIDRDKAIKLIHELYNVENNPTERQIVELLKSIELLEI